MIRTQDEYEASLRELEQLWDSQRGTYEGTRFEELAVAVDIYERAQFTMADPGPTD